MRQAHRGVDPEPTRTTSAEHPRSTSRRLELEAARVRERLERGDPYWPAQAAIAVAIALGLLLTGRVSVGPTWLMPAIEGLLLIAVAVITPARATAHNHGVRRFALAVIGLVSLANIASLLLLVHYLIDGGRTGGHRLILSGLVLWVTNVLLFGVWYWELDRGGPVDRFVHRDALPDLQFPQMDKPEFAPPG